jgi:hypothetical protein
VDEGEEFTGVGGENCAVEDSRYELAVDVDLRSGGKG